MKETYGADTVDDKQSQFIVRFIEGQLLSERIVRLPNGYPTTEREKKIYDENQLKKEDELRKLVQVRKCFIEIIILMKKIPRKELNLSELNFSVRDLNNKIRIDGSFWSYCQANPTEPHYQRDARDDPSQAQWT